MPEILSSIGTFLGPTASGGGGGANLLQGLAGVGGAASNIYTSVNQFQEQNRLQNAQKYIQNLTTNPAKLAAATAQFQQPLSAGLVSGVSNVVQGNLAERGLGSTPAAYTSALTQAIAPYVQQNQSTALNELMQSLGLTSNLRSTAAPTQDISKLLAQLKIGGGGTGQNPYQTLYQAEQPANLTTSDPLANLTFPDPNSYQAAA